MRTCFICAINNESILKSVFREKEEKLTFAKAVEIAAEVEEAAKTAKAQVYSKPDEVQMIHTKKPQRNNHNHHHQKSPPPPTKLSASTTARCYRCGNNGHAMKDCRLSITQYATFVVRKDTSKQPTSPSRGHPRSPSSQRLPSTL